MGERKVEVEINGTVSEELSASLAAALREVEAASAMLAALKVAAEAMQDALEGGEFWRDNFAGSDIPTVRAAIKQAEEAGIE